MEDVTSGGVISSQDVLIDILKRFPVKSLLQFMCVSKLWNHLINDPFLATSHLQFNKKASNSGHHPRSILGTTTTPGEHKFDYRIEKTKKKILEHLKIGFPWKLKQEPRKNGEYVDFIGHCNGVICARDFHTIVVCNPITRSFHILPDSGIEVPDLSFEESQDEYYHMRFRESSTPWKLRVSGFGFIDDVVYKVVVVTYGMARMSSQDMDRRPYEQLWVEVYDSRSSSWRRVYVDPDFSYEYLRDNGGYNFSDKCLYWFGRGYGKKERYYTIVSFNLVDEKWDETLLPYKHGRELIFNRNGEHKDDVFGEYGYCEGIGVVRESVFVFVGDQRNKLVHSVWKMNKEEEKVSWTHMYRLNYEGSVGRFCRDGELLLWMKKQGGDGKGEERLVIHNPEKMNDACFGFTDLGFRVGVITLDFVESLVLLDGEREVIEDESEEISSSCEEPIESVVEEEEVYDIGSLFCEKL